MHHVLCVARVSYEFATPTSEALQLVPKYSHTEAAPSSTNLCWEPDANASVPAQNSIKLKCQDNLNDQKQCAQLKLGLSSVEVSDTR